jgi:cell wall-associated NlpC family hydrolase
VTDGRKRMASVLATLCITALSGTVMVAAPTYANPDIDSVKAKVNSLYDQAETASERYNQAKDDLQKAKVRLRALEADLSRQKQKTEAIREDVAAAIVSQYQGQALSSTTQVLLSDNPTKFLDQLSSVSQYNDQRAQMMADFAVQAKQLEMREEAAKRELAKIEKTKEQLAADKAEVDKKAAEAKALLGRLEDRAAAASRSSERTATPVPTNVPASGSAGAAVSYALAQVGDAYVYGASGPNAWDCSGLTMVAWAQAGVSLPHSSSGQQGYGTPVSQSQLQPGDLVFYYSPVHHVGMYIGNGKIVHAANPSAGVRIDPVNSMPYVGAVRPR